MVANPRGPNRYGHVLQLRPPGVRRVPEGTPYVPGDHAAPVALWDLFMLGGDPANGRPNSPDNAAFDPLGRFWIATDQGSYQMRNGFPDGLWAMETEGPQRGTGRLFYACPRGAEMCGPCFTPDGKTLYYLEGLKMMAVSLQTAPEVQVLDRRELFEGAYVQYRWSRQYDLSPDGTRFVMTKNPPNSNVEIVTNWFEELRQLD